ncbi:hypothetical protein JHFBIEKO_2256 [Methylobacterium mesophilicum]|nr:hypothetical protein JHFBIEKO_2256 [Methylobacterium mesophilicum]
MMRMAFRKFVSGLLVFGFGALAPLYAEAREKMGTAETISVPALVGANEAETAQQLGQASRCEPSKYGRKCVYKAEAVEIMFINGAADWFTVTPKNAAYLPSSLGQLGLPTDSAPASSTQYAMRWLGLAGLREVTAFPDGSGNVNYFYIKARIE